MNKRQYLGISLVLLAGCAGQTSTTKPSPASAHISKPNPAAPMPQQEETPKWEATSGASASDLLAQKAADYAKTMQTPDGSAPTKPAIDPLAVQFPNDSKAVKPADKSNGSAIPAVTTPAQSAPTDSMQAAMLASARTGPTNDGPQILPESADFQSSAPKSPGSLDPLGDRLRRRMAQNPRDIADQLDLQLYGLLNDDPTAELAAVSALPGDDRELIAALIDGLGNFRSTVRENGNLLAAQKIKPLLEMADRLRSQADLTVSTVALCRRVDGYGKYDPITPARFPAGRENPAIVYCEVENFLTKQNSQQMWETSLSEQVTLYTDAGMLAWSDTERQVTDECRNRRHDFFAYNVIRFPANLTLGRYMLKVSIVDKNANHVAEATVPVSIFGQ
jgi:hypothetical protein